MISGALKAHFVGAQGAIKSHGLHGSHGVQGSHGAHESELLFAKTLAVKSRLRISFFI